MTRYLIFLPLCLVFFQLSTSSALAQSARTLEKFPADAFQYRLEVRPAVFREGLKEYPMAVSLYRNGKRVDRRILPKAAESLDFEKRAIASHWAIPDASAAKLAAWESGVEQHSLGTLARTVKLGRRGMGLLVSQLDGFDRLFRAHVLYGVEKGKLKEIWSFSETIGRGWQWSFVEPVTRNGQDFLVFRRGVQNYAFASDEEPDTVEIELLDWQAGSLKTASLPTREFTLHVVWIASYPDAIKARQVAENLQFDAFPIYALSVRAYPQLPQLSAQEGHAVFLGNLFLTQEEAQKYQDAIKPYLGDSRIFFLGAQDATGK